MKQNEINKVMAAYSEIPDSAVAITANAAHDRSYKQEQMELKIMESCFYYEDAIACQKT